MIADGGISANSMLGGMAYRSLAGWLTGYVVNSVWQVPVLLGAGLAAARLARRMGAAAVYRVWVGTLLLAVVLPALVDTGWNLQSAWLWVKGLMAGAGASGNVRIEVLPGQAAAGVGLAWAAAPWLLTVVCGMFGVVVLFGLARLGHGLWRVREICREAVPVKLGLVLEVLGNGFRLPRGVKLGQSATVAGPMIAGVWPAWLLVPPGFFEQTLVEDVRAAVAHELAHVRRRDFAANVVCQVLALPVSYHPAAWVLRARLAESREMACDALAAQQTGGAGSYTRSLLRLAAALPKATGALSVGAQAAVGMLDGNRLERRVMEMMQTKKQLNRVGKAGVMAGLLLMTAVAGATVGGMHLRVRADVEGAAQKLATADGPVRWDVGPKLIYAVDPEYPQAERKARVKKYVAQLQVSIGANGKVQDASVASGDRADFNEKAIEAVRAYRFKAAVLHGQPVACSVRIEVNFQLF